LIIIKIYHLAKSYLKYSKLPLYILDALYSGNKKKTFQMSKSIHSKIFESKSAKNLCLPSINEKIEDNFKHNLLRFRQMKKDKEENNHQYLPFHTIRGSII
jgi:hypothetical protein